MTTNGEEMKRQPKPNPTALAKAERDPATLADMEAAVRKVMEHPAKPVAKSENREPTKAELKQRWKLTRR